MESFLRPNWVSYLWSGLAVIFLSWALSGCRFGNRIERSESNDKVTGYYETLPYQLRFCATGTTEKCVDSPTNLVPQELSMVMSNPIGLIISTTDPTRGRIINPFMNPPPGLNVFVDPTLDDKNKAIPGKYDLSLLATSRDQLWTDSKCESSYGFEWTGGLDQSKAHVSGNIQISGRASLHFTITNSFEGDCVHSLQDMYSCYRDNTQCGGATTEENEKRQALVQSIFNDYVTAGAMTSSDIPQMSKLAYEAWYQ